MKFQVLLFLMLSIFLFGEDGSFLKNSLVGIYAVHIPTGNILIDENGEKSFILSSCMKIITIAAALPLLCESN
jgi:hypothetical protein